MKTIAAALVLPLALLACGGESSAPASAPSKTVPAATATIASAAATAVPPTATETPPEPTATSLPEPPAPPPTPVPAPAPVPPAPLSQQPPAPPPATPVPPPTAPAPPVAFNVTARILQFSTSSLTARTGAAVTVNFRNEDASVAHDISFGIAGLGHGHTCFGPCSDTYSFTAPAPGSYPFFCTTHMEMTGTFVVLP